jgi:alpha-tubulin suppressor-like RCC1 family protein
VAMALLSGCGARSSLALPERAPADPCADVECEAPPGPTCVSATTLRTSSAPGTCSEGECSYAFVDMQCPEGCSEGMCALLTSRVRVSAGKFFTCAVTAAGAVKCWGDDLHGQLGDSSSGVGVNSNVPVDVNSLASGALAVSSGAEHACAITTGGAVKCWGSNGSSQLGNPSALGDDNMVDVVGLSSGVVALSAGTSDTCAITAAGAAKCWGLGYYGLVLNSVPTTPQPIAALSSGVLDISTGPNHTCAVISGAAKCCGINAFGQLGIGTKVDNPSFVDVKGLSSGIVALSAGFSETCAVDASGAVKCWGYNIHGQLGDNSNVDSTVPVDVKGLSSGVVDVSLGLNHACALTAAGGVKCWGWNFYGQLGNHFTADSFVPVDVEGLSSGVVAISAGFTHTCAVLATGAIKCWGSNLFGELGAGTSDSSDVPVNVVGF